VKDLISRCPEFEGLIGPACHLRRLADIYPYCPEGSRFCGVKVWELDFLNIQRDF